MVKTNRQKYSNFADYVLNDPFPFKFLAVMSKYFGAIILSLFAGLLWYFGVKEIGVIITLLACVGWYGVFKYHRLGGWKNMPDITSAETLWNREIKFKKRKTK